tara:strand:- start:64 stop:456 length:393 start_codon:yes stop_codon:yes gene_type:complete
MFQSNKSQSSSLGTILAPEIDITGDINVSGNIIVFGKVTGDIVSTGIVNTAKGSRVTGNIKAKSTNISGEVTGNIEVEKKVVLGTTCTLNGNIEAAIITIEEGAKFDGLCSMLKTKETHVEKINTSANSQ